MPDYMRIIGQFYPNVEAYTGGDPTKYEDITWISSPILKSELDSKAGNVDPVIFEKLLNQTLNFNRNGKNIKPGTYLFANGIPSNTVGKMMSLANANLDIINIITGSNDTYGLRIFYHDGDGTNQQDVVNISVTSDRFVNYKRLTDFTQINKPLYNKAIGIELTSGSANNINVELIFSGN